MNCCVFTLPAPAKLNLFLHVIGRRADGYHLLQTVFTFLDLGDEISFRPHDELTLLNPGASPADDNNLILRAARLLQQETGCRQGALLRLKKRIPLGGGLGGGSSDAATCLLGLNQLWQLNLPVDTLADLGMRLGADVPVFVHGQSAFAEGIGEQLTPVVLPDTDYFVLHPGVAVATAGVFADPQLTRNQAALTVAAFLAEPDFLAPDSRFGNICEAVACRQFPVIGQALDWLAKEAGNSRMTGSGACLFARIANRQEGMRIAAHLPAGWQGFVTRSSNRSPLHDALAALARAP